MSSPEPSDFKVVKAVSKGLGSNFYKIHGKHFFFQKLNQTNLCFLVDFLENCEQQK